MDYEATNRRGINLVNFNQNMVGNVGNTSLENYYSSLLGVGRLSYLNALFMTNAANPVPVLQRNSDNGNMISSSMKSRNNNNTASSPVSVVHSTVVNRRNVPLSTDDYQEIDLEGHKTPSIMVGGEARVPMVCIENIARIAVKPTAVENAKDEYRIRGADCTENEFALLRSKMRNIGSNENLKLLPYSSAEFFIRSLLHEKGKIISRSETVEVRHGVRVKARVFGKQRGFFRSDLYVTPDAQCIECDTCGTFFAPDKFVGHTHQPETLGVVHWGYKPSEWRRYLCIFRDKKNKDLSQPDARQRSMFQELVNRFDNTPRQLHYKRKAIMSQAYKVIDPNRKRTKTEAIDMDFPPIKRISRGAIDTPKTINDHSDALYAPNVNVGAIAHEGKSAFTPIEKKDAVSGFSKEDAMMDRLKKQYHLVKDGVEKLHISNTEKQSMLVEWANLNQGFATLYNSMKNRIIAHKQAEHQISSSITSLGSEIDIMRNENLNLKSQIKLMKEEIEKSRRPSSPSKLPMEPMPARDRYLYRATMESLSIKKNELNVSEMKNKALTAENDRLKEQIRMLMCERKPMELPIKIPISESIPDTSDTLQPHLPLSSEISHQEITKSESPIELPHDDNDEDDSADEIDSAATESAPGSSQPGSPDGSDSPFNVIGSVVVCPRREKPAGSFRGEHDEDEFGPPTLTREQD